jgi:NAD(P)-dependent dehydrogenase (short-subunit alcohol dehydrogenase family)
MTSRFESKVVIGIAAKTGIGAATARRFHAERAAVVMNALERVPQRRIAGPHLVHREVALEIAAFGTKQLDTRFDIGPPGRRPGRRIRRRRKLAEIECGAAVQHAAEFDGEQSAAARTSSDAVPLAGEPDARGDFR